MGGLLIAQTRYRNIDKGREEVPGKELCNSPKLRKVVAIYETSKLVLFFKTKGSEKVLYSKSSCFRYIFCNQLIKYSLFSVSLWAMINTEERTLIVSPYVAVVELS